jgi:hypothetical protein
MIRNYIRKKYIARVLKKNKRTVLFPKQNTINEIAIVSDKIPDTKHSEISAFKQANISYMFYCDSKREKTSDENIIYASDLNFLKLPPKEKIIDFVEKPFDLLFDLSTGNNDVIDYICAKSIAKFKICSHNNNAVFDLIISKKEIDFEEIISETEQIIKNFNSKK